MAFTPFSWKASSVFIFFPFFWHLSLIFTYNNRNKTSDLGLLATILDPCLKKLSLFDSDTKQNVIEKLKEIYLQYEENETLVNENSSNLSETSRYSSNFFERRT